MADRIETEAALHVQADNLPTGFLPAANKLAAVGSALRRYDRDFPRYVFGSFVGDGTRSYDLSAQSLTGWDEDDSWVSEISYPYTVTDESVLDSANWSVVEDPTNGKTLVFAGSSPSSSQTVRVKYVAKWTEQAVPETHLTAVSQLAASYMARMLAARFAQKGQSTINADVFNATSNSSQWLTLAKRFEEKYEEILGIDGDTEVPAAISITNVDEGGQYGYGPLTEQSLDAD